MYEEGCQGLSRNYVHMFLCLLCNPDVCMTKTSPMVVLAAACTHIFFHAAHSTDSTSDNFQTNTVIMDQKWALVMANYELSAAKNIPFTAPESVLSNYTNTMQSTATAGGNLTPLEPVPGSVSSTRQPLSQQGGSVGASGGWPILGRLVPSIQEQCMY